VEKYVLDHTPTEEVFMCFGEDQIKSIKSSKGRFKSVPPFLTPSNNVDIKTPTLKPTLVVT
jgi:hypothetical protein